MSLSDETLKNLLDVMQKLTLAMTIVSVALFSNFVLSQQSRMAKAVEELKNLLRIQQKAEDQTPEMLTYAGIDTGPVGAVESPPFGTGISLGGGDYLGPSTTVTIS